LTDMPGAEESPAISPDGKSVAFVAAVNGKRQIWTGEPITKDDSDHYAPRWSPDSHSLIYFADGAIWEIPALGGQVRKLVDALGPGDLNHEGKLAFFRRAGDAVELVADGTMIAKLTGSGTYSNLRWSPDDKKIAFLQDMKIMVISASGGDPVQAAQGLTVQGFTWTPDNSGLIVSNIVLTGGELWFVPRKDRDAPSQLTFGELSYESPDIGPTGNLVVSRRGLATGADSDIVMFSGLKW